MQFIFPAFLFALLSLAVPVIIHLFYFRRLKKVYFSDVRFLKEVQEERSAVDKLKRRLVLAMRLLALLFLVLAFAQPFWGRQDKDQVQGRAAVCVYIDNSPSMGLLSGGEPALSLAKSKAAELAEAFGPADRFCLLTNDSRQARQRWMGKADFLSAVEKVALVNGSRTVPEVFQQMHALFTTAGMPNKMGFLVSDFQRHMALPATDSSFTAHFVPVPGTAAHNLYADTCWFEDPVFTLNASNKLLVRFRNAGTSDAEKIRVSVRINGQVKAVDDIDIPAGKAVLDSFSLSVTQAGWQQGTVEFNDYPVTFDDRFYFAFRAEATESVLLITDAASSGMPARVFRDDAHFSLRQANKGQLDYSTFGDHALIILDQPAEISSGLAAALGAYLDGGGSVYLVPSPTANLSSYNAFTQALGLPAFGPLSKQAGAVTRLNLQEAVFRGVFRQLPKNPDLPSVQQFYPAAGAGQGAERPLLLTNTGTPLLSVSDAGNGLLYRQSAPIGPAFTDLADKAIYPPLVYNMAVYKRYSQPLYHTIGRENLLELKGSGTTGESVYTLTNGQLEFIPEHRNAGSVVLLRVNQELGSDGIFSIRSGQAEAGQAAFNFDRRESSMDQLPAAELSERYAADGQQVLDQSMASLTASVKQVKEGVILWKLCLILCLVFLLSETLLLRFLK